MPEWSNGAVSKTVELLVGSGGSNPPLSAERPRRYQRRGLSAERGGWPTKSAFFLPPSKPSPMGRLSRFAPRVQWSGVSAEFSSPSRIPSVLLPQRQHFPRFSAVVELLFRRILAMGFLDSIVSPVPFHNGSISRDSLPLRNGFSAASLLWASWTALSPQSPSTTAPISAFLCRCGMAFPPHPCYGLPGRHCLPSPLPQRQHFPRFSAVVELLFRRILAMGFLDSIVSPGTFHNGTDYRIFLSLR